MDLKLNGKVAIVTGASKGIGRGIATELAREGMSLVIAARSESQLESLAIVLRGQAGAVMVHAADLSQPDAPAAMVATTVAKFGRIDLLVNNAGATKRGDFLSLSEEDWHQGYALKFFAAVRATRAAWPHLVAVGGSVVNIAGVGGRTGHAEFTIGGSVNAAMLNLTKSLSDRAVAEGVRVNAINPGSIMTDRLVTRLQRLADEGKFDLDEAAKRMASHQGIARFGTVEEIAGAVAFLASERGAYLNGAVIDIDGGMTRTL